MVITTDLVMKVGNGSQLEMLECMIKIQWRETTVKLVVSSTR
jgi:hypothetical protein